MTAASGRPSSREAADAFGVQVGEVAQVVDPSFAEHEFGQAANNTKEQFSNSFDLKTELLNAIMGTLDAHTSLSTQALNSATVQSGIKDILLNHARLWEALRGQSAA